MVQGNRAHLSGLNVKGLSRRGFSREDIRTIRRAYKALYDEVGDVAFAERVDAVAREFEGNPHVGKMVAFLKKKRSRPLCTTERGR